ncbi:hypothetical protein [Inhella crocodyli]|uniref:Uncharacterized protein n=1 Tax=Inhella crocodyli TaxID=2499851 RepID=A0A3S2XY92_9BURK|nr:hypothetical protein [Inhella crocodyli]RVT87534.1 hypothetical protein EOD73_00445 [Inhella crocodyli]
MSPLRLRAAPLALACALSACGGGREAEMAPPVDPDPLIAGTDVRTSATVSSAGATAFVATASAMDNDSAEPLALGDAQLATSDTEEPVE